MKYRNHTIEKSGFNYRVRDQRGSYMESGIAANVQRKAAPGDIGAATSGLEALSYSTGAAKAFTASMY